MTKAEIKGKKAFPPQKKKEVPYGNPFVPVRLPRADA
jgi:hypothetical protein